MLLFYLFFKIGILHYINLSLVFIDSLASRHSIPNYKLSCSVQWVGSLALTQYDEANPDRMDSSDQKQALFEHASDCVNDFCISALASKYDYDENDIVLVDAENHPEHGIEHKAGK